MELFQSSKKLHAEEHDSSVAKLLRERSSIAASLRSVNDIIRYMIVKIHDLHEDTRSACAINFLSSDRE
jgi:hypothetical protein